MLNGIITALSAPLLLTFCAFQSKKMLFVRGQRSAQQQKWRVGMPVGRTVWVLGVLHYYQRIKHHILWSGVIWGNSQVRPMRLQSMAGIKVIVLWMRAQSSQEIPNRTGFMLVNNPQKYLADRKMLLMSPSFIFGTFGRNKKKKKGFFRLDRSISNASCNGYSWNERTWKHAWNVFFAKTTGVLQELFVWNCGSFWREAVLRITGHLIIVNAVPLAKTKARDFICFHIDQGQKFIWNWKFLISEKYSRSGPRLIESENK